MALYLVGVLGGRFHDISLVKYAQLAVALLEPARHQRKGDRMLQATFTEGKNHGNHVKNTQVVEEDTSLSLIRPLAYAETFYQDVAMMQERGFGDQRPFEGLTTNGIGGLLRRMSAGFTTYALRQHYAARWFAQSGDKHIVAQKMGHANPKKTEAFYMTVEMLPVVQAYRKMFGRE